MYIFGHSSFDICICTYKHIFIDINITEKPQYEVWMWSNTKYRIYNVFIVCDSSIFPKYLKCHTMP